MPPLRVVFLGTPDFAAASLNALYAAPDLVQVVAVISQPDRRRGRGRNVPATPVKEVARTHGTQVLQPEKIRRNPEVRQKLQTLAPDIGVVAAFGQFIPKSILAIPPLGMINVHASLLPRWRGAAPIAHAILSGDEQTGVSIMRVGPHLDAGPWVLQRAIPIDDNDTAASLTERLATIGSHALIEALHHIHRGQDRWTDQDSNRATLAPVLAKSDGIIDWNRPATETARLVRAFAPWPGARTTVADIDLQLWGAIAEPQAHANAPGTVLAARKDLVVACGMGVLRITTVQTPGKRRMPTASFLAGMRQDLVGLRCGA